MSELNPNHPVTRALENEWHKFLAMALYLLDTREVEVTREDIIEFDKARLAIVADCRGGRLVLRLMPIEEANTLARQAGGGPT